MPANLAFPSRDGRLEKPTLALVGADEAVTVGTIPRPERGLAQPYGEGARGTFDDPAAFEAVVQAARTLGLEGGRVAVEMTWVPAGAVAALEAAMPRLQITPLGPLLTRAKAEKSEEELAGLREALELADAGQVAFRAAVAPGVSEVELYSAVVRAMDERAGGMALALSEIQVGTRTEVGMGPPTALRVQQGELAMCDIAPRHPNGWWGDCCSTVACGKPSEHQRRIWQELRDGLEAGGEALRPGVQAGAVYAAVVKYAGELTHHAGHGIGRDHFEEPVIRPGVKDEIPEDAVIVLEPGRYQDGFGIRIEWAFRVTPGGGEPLTHFPLEL
jgi:Xaa-Pro dipeptidase